MQEEFSDRPGGRTGWFAPLAAALGVVVAASIGLVLSHYDTPSSHPAPTATSTTVMSTPAPRDGLAVRPRCPTGATARSAC